jgi:hypothetical protein
VSVAEAGSGSPVPDSWPHRPFIPSPWSRAAAAGEGGCEDVEAGGLPRPTGKRDPRLQLLLSWLVVAQSRRRGAAYGAVWW